MSATDNDPPPLPRPHDPANDPFDRLREVWTHLGARAVVLATPATVFVVVAVAGILLWSRLAAAPPTPLEVALPTVDPASLAIPTTSAETADSELVIVHVAGAVARPGIYQVAATARVGDAIDLAGGPVADADLDRINLAAAVADGAQIQVPRTGQAVVAPLEPVAGTRSDTSRIGPIDLNTADAAELETLPGVGPSTAAAIIAHRDEHGPFPSVAALDDVAGIGPAKLEALRDLVTVGVSP